MLKFLLFFQLLYVVNQIHLPLETHIPGVAMNNILFFGILLALRFRQKPDQIEIHARLRKPLLYLFGALVFAFLVSQVREFDDVVADLTNLKNLISFPLFYFVYLHSKQDEETTRWLIIWILVIAAVAGVEAIREGFDYGFGKYNAFRRASGPFDKDWHGANVAGVFFGMFMPMFVAIVLFLRKQPLWRMAGVAGIVTLGGGAIFTYSRQSYLIIVVGTALLLLRRSLILATIVSVALISSVGYLPDSVFERVDETHQVTKKGEDATDVSTAMRWEIWAGALGMVADHPIGVGLKRFSRHIGEYCPHKGYDAHNFYVLMLAEAGPQGLICFLYLLWCLFGLTRWLRIHAATDDPEAKALSIGFTVATICMCMGGLYGSPLLREGSMMAPFWALAGLLERYTLLKMQNSARGAVEPEAVGASMVDRFPLAVHLPGRRARPS